MYICRIYNEKKQYINIYIWCMYTSIGCIYIEYGLQIGYSYTSINPDIFYIQVYTYIYTYIDVLAARNWERKVRWKCLCVSYWNKLYHHDNVTTNWFRLTWSSWWSSFICYICLGVPWWRSRPRRSMSLTELMWVSVIACCINDVSFLICRWRRLTVLISKSFKIYSTFFWCWVGHGAMLS